MKSSDIQFAPYAEPHSMRHAQSENSSPTATPTPPITYAHILRMKQLVERTGLSRATLYVLMSTDPTFPRKVKLSARCVGWIAEDVVYWLSSRIQPSPTTTTANKEAA